MTARALRWGGALGATVLLILGVVPAVAASPPGDLVAAAPTGCAVHEPTPIAADAVEDATDLPSVGQQQKIQVRSLGQDRNVVEYYTSLDLSQPLPAGVEYLNLAVGQFERLDGKVIDAKKVTASAAIDQEGRRDHLLVTVCVDPSGAHAGSYTGTVAVDDPRVTGGSATYTLNMQFAPVNRVYVLVAAAWLLGSLAGLTLASRVEVSNPRKGVPRILIALGLSAVAVWTVFATQFLSNLSWEGTILLWATLLAGCFGAAYGASNFSGSVPVGGEKDGEDEVA
ncbi:hypothetical protein [Cellulomonas sp. P5_C5]